MTIELRNTPWNRPSRGSQRVHAIMHAVKAAAKLVCILESEDHGGVSGEPTAEDQPKYAADLVISAIRLSDVVGFNLEFAVKHRQKTKN